MRTINDFSENMMKEIKSRVDDLVINPVPLAIVASVVGYFLKPTIMSILEIFLATLGLSTSLFALKVTRTLERERKKSERVRIGDETKNQILMPAEEAKIAEGLEGLSAGNENPNRKQNTAQLDVPMREIDPLATGLVGEIRLLK